MPLVLRTSQTDEQNFSDSEEAAALSIGQECIDRGDPNVSITRHAYNKFGKSGYKVSVCIYAKVQDGILATIGKKTSKKPTKPARRLALAA